MVVVGQDKLADVSFGMTLVGPRWRVMPSQRWYRAVFTSAATIVVRVTTTSVWQNETLRAIVLYFLSFPSLGFSFRSLCAYSPSFFNFFSFSFFFFFFFFSSLFTISLTFPRLFVASRGFPRSCLRSSYLPPTSLNFLWSLALRRYDSSTLANPALFFHLHFGYSRVHAFSSVVLFRFLGSSKATRI